VFLARAAGYFAAHGIPHQYVQAVPLSRIYQVIDEALRRAGVWDEVVRELQARIRSHH